MYKFIGKLLTRGSHGPTESRCKTLIGVHSTICIFHMCTSHKHTSYTHYCYSPMFCALTHFCQLCMHTPIGVRKSLHFSLLLIRIIINSTYWLIVGMIVMKSYINCTSTCTSHVCSYIIMLVRGVDHGPTWGPCCKTWCALHYIK